MAPAGYSAGYDLTMLVSDLCQGSKRFEILGLLSPRSGTLVDLGPCMSFLPWDSGNPGPQNCVMPQDPGNPGPQILICSETLKTKHLKILLVARPWKPRTLKFGYVAKPWKPRTQNLKFFDVSRLKRPWPLHHSIQNFMLSIVPGSSTGDELGRLDSKNLNCKKCNLPDPPCRWKVVGCSFRL